MVTYAVWFEVCLIRFQCMLNTCTIFAEEIGKNVFIYLAGMIICGKDFKSHLDRLETVFLRRRQADLKAKLTKCELLKSKIQF